MNIIEAQTRLREKERELLADMTRTEEEARAASSTGAQNGEAASENRETVFRETSSDWQVFAQVRDALQRIEQGTFGKCVECGREIETHRLESVPWAAYCLHHQKQQDAAVAARPC